MGEGEAHERKVDSECRHLVGGHWIFLERGKKMTGRRNHEKEGNGGKRKQFFKNGEKKKLLLY